MKRRPKFWTPDEEVEMPSWMVGTASGVTVEDDEKPTKRLVFLDGTFVPRRPLGFQPPRRTPP